MEMNRRKLIKIFAFGTLAAAGGGSMLNIYKHAAGVGKILEYPHPILRRKSEPVKDIDEKILALSRQMITTLRYHSLIGFFSRAFLSRGLAAPQLGVAKRLIVCGIRGEIKVLLNPAVIEKKSAYASFENCLSVPSQAGLIINRPGWLKVRYTGFDNQERVLTAAGEYAALLAHEIDHLNGVLFIDYI
jgi:peptide deformylase